MLLRSFVNSVTDKLTGALSLGAACFAAILAASQLPSELHVVSPLSLALPPSPPPRCLVPSAIVAQTQTADAQTPRHVPYTSMGADHPKQPGVFPTDCLLLRRPLFPPPVRPAGCQFAYVLFSLELFLLSPYMRRYIKRASSSAHVGVTLGLAAAATALLLPLSRASAAAFAAALLVISFGCPAALIRIHKYKAKITGPWDEAVPHVPRELVVMRPAVAAAAAMAGGAAASANESAGCESPPLHGGRARQGGHGEVTAIAVAPCGTRAAAVPDRPGGGTGAACHAARLAATAGSAANGQGTEQMHSSRDRATVPGAPAAEAAAAPSRLPRAGRGRQAAARPVPTGSDDALGSPSDERQPVPTSVPAVVGGGEPRRRSSRLANVPGRAAAPGATTASMQQA